ncbi:hypothetical protein T439DRAFT_69002 [Meredithblackwellia eburnea MCA 4105]
MSREAAVLLREQAVLARETTLRAGMEALKDAQLKVAQAQAQALAQQQQQHQFELETENARPRLSGDQDVMARVASRPSMVPRRPLVEERRASNAFAIPFPRLSSASSLMSLDDTPVKEKITSVGRRLASKSMYDLASAAGFGPNSGTPSRATTISEFGNLTIASTAPSSATTASSVSVVAAATISSQYQPNQSPMSVTGSSFGQRSESISRSMGSPSRRQSSSPKRPDAPSPVLVPFRPTPPSPTKAPSSGGLGAPPSMLTGNGSTSSYGGSSGRPSPDQRSLPQFDPDDMPSPFLKKTDSSRFPSSTSSSASSATTVSSAGSTTEGLAPAPPPKAAIAGSRLLLPGRARSSMGTKPSLSSRLLAARAQVTTTDTRVAVTQSK